MTNPAPILRLILTAALLAAGGMACSSSSDTAASDPGGRVVATVGERTITLADLDHEIGQYRSLLRIRGGEEDESGVERLRRALLTRVVDETLLEVEADRQGIVVTEDDLDQEMKSLLGEYDESRLQLVLAESEITFNQWRARLARRIKIRKLTVGHVDAAAEATDQEVKDYFTENAEDFRWPERVRALQIMVHEEGTAAQLRRQVADGADFRELARKWSQSPDAIDGGDLGYFSRGQMPPEFEDAVFNLKPGAVSEVIKSLYGFHLFKVLARDTPRAMTFEESRDRIREIIVTRKREERFATWLSSLKKGIPVTIRPEALSGGRPSS